jgi:hypothetical protein
MNSSGGLFAAQDSSLSYAFLDATFFRMRVLQRAPNQTFTEAALASGATIVVNGQVFAAYCKLPRKLHCALGGGGSEHSSPSVTLGIHARAIEPADRLAVEAIGKLFAPPKDKASVPRF